MPLGACQGITIPTKMPFQAVFMRGGAGPACMDDLVVDQCTSDGESSSNLVFCFSTTSGRCFVATLARK